MRCPKVHIIIHSSKRNLTPCFVRFGELYFQDVSFAKSISLIVGFFVCLVGWLFVF